MIISVLNHTDGKVKDFDLQKVISAINRQIKEDFEPYWSMGATIRLDGRTGSKPKETEHPDLRGDAIIYLWDKVNLKDADGFHSLFDGIPSSFFLCRLFSDCIPTFKISCSTS